MKKQLFFITFIILGLCSAQAQQLPLLTQYHEYRTFINPAALNSDEMLTQRKGTLNFGTRRQWSNINGAPTNFILKGDYIPLKSSNRNSILLTGGHIMQYNVGPTKLIGINAKLGVLITDDRRYHGLSVGFNIGYNKLDINIPDIYFPKPENFVFQDNFKANYVSTNSGFFAYQALSKSEKGNNILYIGGSVAQPFYLGKQNTVQAITSKPIRHYYGLTGFIHTIDNDRFWEVYAWQRYIPSLGFQMDVNGRYQFIRNVWLGMGSSIQKNIHAEFGFHIPPKWTKDWLIKIGTGVTIPTSTGLVGLGTTGEITITVVILN